MLLPSAVTEMGLTETVVVVLLGRPALNVTDVVLFTGPKDAVTVFASAVVEASVVEKMPALLVLPELWPKLLLEPLLVNDTAWLGMALPCAS